MGMVGKKERKERMMKQTATVEQVAIMVAERFIRSESERAYAVTDQMGRSKSYTLELELNQQEKGHWLTVTTWGYDCEEIWVPRTWQELIRRKTWLQMAESPNGADKVFLRYCFEVMREYERVAQVS